MGCTSWWLESFLWPYPRQPQWVNPEGWDRENQGLYGHPKPHKARREERKERCMEWGKGALFQSQTFQPRSESRRRGGDIPIKHPLNKRIPGRIHTTERSLQEGRNGRNAISSLLKASDSCRGLPGTRRQERAPFGLWHIEMMCFTLGLLGYVPRCLTKPTHSQEKLSEMKSIKPRQQKQKGMGGGTGAPRHHTQETRAIGNVIIHLLPAQKVYCPPFCLV